MSECSAASTCAASTHRKALDSETASIQHLLNKLVVPGTHDRHQCPLRLLRILQCDRLCVVSCAVIIAVCSKVGTRGAPAVPHILLVLDSQQRRTCS